MPCCYTASTTPSSICDVRSCGRNGAFRVGNEEPYPLDIEFMRKVTAPRLVATKTPNVEPLTPNVEPQTPNPVTPPSADLDPSAAPRGARGTFARAYYVAAASHLRRTLSAPRTVSSPTRASGLCRSCRVLPTGSRGRRCTWRAHGLQIIARLRRYRRRRRRHEWY